MCKWPQQCWDLTFTATACPTFALPVLLYVAELAVAPARVEEVQRLEVGRVWRLPANTLMRKMHLEIASCGAARLGRVTAACSSALVRTALQALRCTHGLLSCSGSAPHLKSMGRCCIGLLVSSALHVGIRSPWHACSSERRAGRGRGRRFSKGPRSSRRRRIAGKGCGGSWRRGWRRRLVRARHQPLRPVGGRSGRPFGGRLEASIFSLLLAALRCVRGEMTFSVVALFLMCRRRAIVSMQRWCRHACLDAAATRATLWLIVCAVSPHASGSRVRGRVAEPRHARGRLHGLEPRGDRVAGLHRVRIGRRRLGRSRARSWPPCRSCRSACVAGGARGSNDREGERERVPTTFVDTHTVSHSHNSGPKGADSQWHPSKDGESSTCRAQFSRRRSPHFMQPYQWTHMHKITRRHQELVMNTGILGPPRRCAGPSGWDASREFCC